MRSLHTGPVKICARHRIPCPALTTIVDTVWPPVKVKPLNASVRKADVCSTFAQFEGQILLSSDTVGAFLQESHSPKRAVGR